MIMKTLYNDFHNTEVRLRIKQLPATLSPGQFSRARRTLCGMADCTCGDTVSARGSQDVRITPTQDARGRLSVVLQEL